MTSAMQHSTRPTALGHGTRLFALATLTGIVAGLAAACLEWGLDVGVHHLIGRVASQNTARVLEFRYELLVLPAVGGLISGVMVMIFCPTSTGQGTEVLTRAFHRHRGQLELKGPLVKASAAVAVISCGGSAGPEGPIAALGAALGSTGGKLFRVTATERRILLIAGCAAGVGAIFRCPLGGTLFAVSALYSEPDYESDAIMPSLVASVAGYSVFMALWGHSGYLIPNAEKLVFTSPFELLPFVVLGPLCGAMAIWLATCYWAVESILVRPGRLPRWLAPAVGGLATGGLACLLPQVMDARYEFIGAAMEGAFFGDRLNWWPWVGLFAAAALLKCLATGCTVGSGGAGGVLGPCLAIGGLTGAFLGAACEALFPGIFPEPLRQALIPVGMGGVLAASMRVPMAAIVMVVEMTGSYGLIVPIMLVCVTSYVLGRRWGLNPEQVPTAAESPVHAADAVLRYLESARVADLVEPEWKQTVPPDATLDQLGRLIEPGQQPVFMVVRDGCLLGVIALPDLDRVLSHASPHLGRVVLAYDIMNEHFTALLPDRTLYHALELFRHDDRDVLPVVSEDEPRRLLGVLRRRRILHALLGRIGGLKDLVLEEHQGLSAIDREAHLDHLLMALGPGKGLEVRRLMVPLDAVGRSIRKSDFRNRYGLQIVAVERPDGTIQCPADPDAPLEASQRLLAIASTPSPAGPPANP
jgi:CIC family chloride channel protein